MSMLAVQICLT